MKVGKYKQTLVCRFGVRKELWERTEEGKGGRNGRRMKRMRERPRCKTNSYKKKEKKGVRREDPVLSPVAFDNYSFPVSIP